MIEILDISKRFEEIQAVDHVNIMIKEGSVFGLIGTNGAGKSTVLRMICGVLRPDEGQVLIDGIPVFDHVDAKEKLFFIADEPYFFANATPEDMGKYYISVFPKFDLENYHRYLDSFGLGRRRKVATFSKGMKKQLAILLGICARTKYLFCDETFDGLDPVMRQGIKSLMAKEMDERGMTPIIASHNLRELEDICDHVGLLHRGGVLLSRDLEEMKLNIQKVQCVLDEGVDAAEVFGRLNIVKSEQRGSLYTLTIRGSREEIINYFSTVRTIFFEALPLSLEEIFISETEVVGYDIKKIIFG
ncbi:ABC transporter ATP-binding protein [Lachnospiraceae bacterium JLR.KK008]